MSAYFNSGAREIRKSRKFLPRFTSTAVED
jgi:hypothetical protein